MRNESEDNKRETGSERQEEIRERESIGESRRNRFEPKATMIRREEIRGEER